MKIKDYNDLIQKVNTIKAQAKHYETVGLLSAFLENPINPPHSVLLGIRSVLLSYGYEISIQEFYNLFHHKASEPLQLTYTQLQQGLLSDIIVCDNKTYCSYIRIIRTHEIELKQRTITNMISLAAKLNVSIPYLCDDIISNIQSFDDTLTDHELSIIEMITTEKRNYFLMNAIPQGNEAIA